MRPLDGTLFLPFQRITSKQLMESIEVPLMPLPPGPHRLAYEWLSYGYTIGSYVPFAVHWRPIFSIFPCYNNNTPLSKSSSLVKAAVPLWSYCETYLGMVVSSCVAFTVFLISGRFHETEEHGKSRDIKRDIFSLIIHAWTTKEKKKTDKQGLRETENKV